MIVAAGLFLVRKDNKILVGHPTRHKATFWSIPKGKVEEGEENINAAIRETYEESNVDVSNWSIVHNLEPVKYTKTKKILYPFVLFEKQNKFDFNQFELKCNSNVPEDKGGFPEMDDFKWVTIEEGRSLLHETQVACLDKIEEIINKLNGKA
jgi:8-oxo-dGTP pyrophosphatase MutT (NUDIX family)